jgi:RNA polymerase sigma-70 factor, ECF subfamily
LPLFNEIEIVKRSKTDKKAFGQIYDYYYPKIFGYIFRRIGDYDIARDISAETFLKAFININQFKSIDNSISAWLFKIATNELNLYFRQKKYKPTLFSNIQDEMHLDQELLKIFEREKTEFDLQHAHYEQFNEIQKHVKTLETHYQEVLALRYFEEKSIKEIAEILAKPVGTVKSLLSRAIEKLRKKM